MDNFHGLNITASLSMINTVSFLCLSIIEFLLYRITKKLTYYYSSLLLAIAGSHYAVLDVNKPSIEQEIYIRYSDWIFTTPLLLYVLGLHYNISFNIIRYWILLDLVMVISGIYYELTNNVRYWTLGTISYILLVFLLYKQLPDKKYLIRYFIIGWSGYGIVSRFQPSKRIFYYNILDFYNKFVFALDINNDY